MTVALIWALYTLLKSLIFLSIVISAIGLRGDSSRHAVRSECKWYLPSNFDLCAYITSKMNSKTLQEAKEEWLKLNKDVLEMKREWTDLSVGKFPHNHTPTSAFLCMFCV